MLFDAAGRPLPTSRDIPRASRDAGAFRGSLSGWRGPQVTSRLGMAREREVIQRRAADLLANDWAANATVDTITGNAVGTGLLPADCQTKVDTKKTPSSLIFSTVVL